MPLSARQFQQVSQLREEARGALQEMQVADAELGEVRAFLEKWIAQLPPSPMRTAVKTHMANPGRGLRASLALRAAEFFGLDNNKAYAVAAVVELIHAATLIHDDIQDEDATRRGHDALWVQCGVGQAINAADLLLIAPPSVLALTNMSDAEVGRAMLVVSRQLMAVAHGQSLDLIPRTELASDPWTSYIEASRGKTGALFGLALELAAVIAGRHSTSDTAMRDMIEELIRMGVVYQIIDDLADLAVGTSGRAPGRDVETGKNCAPIAALSLVGDEFTARSGLISQTLELGELDKLVYRLAQHGCFAAIRDEMVRPKDPLLETGESFGLPQQIRQVGDRLNRVLGDLCDVLQTSHIHTPESTQPGAPAHDA